MSSMVPEVKVGLGGGSEVDVGFLEGLWSHFSGHLWPAAQLSLWPVQPQPLQQDHWPIGDDRETLAVLQSRGPQAVACWEPAARQEVSGGRA